jgi:hypothetical protein
MDGDSYCLTQIRASHFGVATLFEGLPGKWEKYPELKPTNRLKALIEEIEKGPYRVF